MTNLQEILFRWIAEQSGLAGLVIFAIGLLYGFQGMRLFRFLLVITSGILGWTLGWTVGEHVELAPDVIALTGAGLFACGSLAWYRPSVLVACGATQGALGYYLAGLLGLGPVGAWIIAGLSAGFGVLLAALCFRTWSVVLTTMQGAVLMVIGFVGFTSAFVPSVGSTFRAWAANQSFLVPVLIAMVFVTGFSYQAMHQRGDIKSGV